MLNKGKGCYLDERTFRVVWGWMEEAGQVDALGGAQFRRIRQAWREAGRPLVGLSAFIRVRE